MHLSHEDDTRNMLIDVRPYFTNVFSILWDGDHRECVIWTISSILSPPMFRKELVNISCQCLSCFRQASKLLSQQNTLSVELKKIYIYVAKAAAQIHCSLSFAGLRSWSEIFVLYAHLIVESFDDTMSHGLILAVIRVSLQASEIPTMITVFF